MGEFEVEGAVQRVPMVVDQDSWKTVTLRIVFNIVGEPIVVDMDTGNLIAAEAEKLTELLGFSVLRRGDHG